MEVDYSNLPVHLEKVQNAMRPLQVRCVSHLKKNPRCIIDSWMGTGKTLMGLTATFLRKPKRVLIACSKNALWTWQKEIEKWYPEYNKPGMYNVVSGTAIGREFLWQKDALFYVCTYNALRADMDIVEKMDWDVFILDEFHRSGLRQHTIYKKRKTDRHTGKPIKTLTGFGQLRRLMRIPTIYPISGTVISKGPQDAWPTLHLLDKSTFASYWKFTQKFCEVEEGFFGNELVGAKNTDLLYRMAQHCWYHIPRELAEKELPPLTKQVIPIDMTPVQAKMHEQFERDMYVELKSGDFLVSSTTLSAKLRLRQLLTCPKIIDPDLDDYGAGIQAVQDMISDRENHHVVIFTPFRAGVTYFKEYVRKNITEDVYHIWGGLELEDLKARVEAWKKSKGLMVCTIQFSQSFELETSQACYFIGCEWDENDNDQASARLRRLISPGPVSAYYFKHNGSIVDERVFEVTQSKRGTCKVTMQDFRKMLLDMEAKYGK